jgi:opacity protein-like surface antigen
MKKLLLIVSLFAFALTMSAQSLLKPLPKTLFKDATEKARILNKDVTVSDITSLWEIRLNAGITGVSYFKNKETGKLDKLDLSALCFGIGYLHYKNTAEGPFNDFGLNLLLLQNLQSAGMGLGVYGTYNTGPIGLLNLGVHYDFFINQFLLDTGLSFHF